MANSNDTGLEGNGRTRKEECFETTGALPLYPPGPKDREEWKELLRRFPEVEPAYCKENHMQYEMPSSESELSRIIAGPSGRLDAGI